jgi:hypothetical protein
LPWLVRFEGQELNTEDLTRDELEAIEQITTVPWVLLNPVHSMPVAKSLLALCLVKGGMADDQARDKVGQFKVRDIHDVFTLVDQDIPTTWADGQPDPKAAPAARTSGSSGRGGRSAGRRT